MVAGDGCPFLTRYPATEESDVIAKQGMGGREGSGLPCEADQPFALCPDGSPVLLMTGPVHCLIGDSTPS